MTPEILREGGDQIIVVQAGSGEAGDAAATSGRSEPCFACRTSRFDFFERPIFLPNKISRKGKADRSRFRLFAIATGIHPDEPQRCAMLTAVWCDSKAVPCFAPHGFHTPLPGPHDAS